MKRKSEYQLIWEAYVTEAEIDIGEPDFSSLERDKLAGVGKEMPTSDVEVNPLADMSIEELEDKLVKIQSELTRRKGADTEGKYQQAKDLFSKMKDRPRPGSIRRY